MKAAVFENYGPPGRVLRLKEVEKPVPGEGRVLLRVLASSVSISDYGIMGLSRFFGGGLLRPKDTRIRGEVAGRVDAVGANVSRFRPGDEVFGTCSGAFAEFAVAREVRLAKKLANVTFEEAAAVPVAGLPLPRVVMPSCEGSSAGGGIRTHEPLRDGSLSPTPLTMLGDPRARNRPPNRILKALSGQQAFNE